MDAARLRDGPWPTAVVGLCAGVAGVIGSFVAAGYTPGFVVGPIEGALARTMPAVVVRFAITLLGDLGQQLSLATATGIAVGALGGAAAVALVAGRRLGSRPLPAVATLAFGWAFAALVTGDPVLAAGAGVPAGLVVGIAEFAPRDSPGAAGEGRRRILASLGSLAGIGLLGYVVGREGSPGSGSADPDPAGIESGGEESIDDLLGLARERSFEVDGLEPLVSEEFYQVDINAVDPSVDASEWSLRVTGAVEQEVSLDYAELRSMPPETRFVTLRCVGDQLNGRKVDNALWTGVPIADLLDRADPGSGCECVLLRAADDYYQEFPLSALENGLLAYAMNGRVLPRPHGYPARALVPGHWGEINVKWLTEIELLDREVEGYWEKRGWHGTGPVNTVAKLHLVEDLPDGRKRVGGHAYAGTRGVERVEVSTDGGGTWTDADLSEPLPGEDVWRQWIHTYDPPDGRHGLVVRAVEATGERQPREYSEPFPRGASGWVSLTLSSD